MKFSVRDAVPALLMALSAGCSQIPSATPQPVSYVCDGGKHFSVIYAPARDAATIDIAGSRFGLQAEPTNGVGERYGCGVLTLWRDGDGTRVDMQGAGMFENCRRRE
ncbi:MliC family protein [Aromatoleum diolicum]|uniref:C-type lysozyme inhibitor domain-containing protein n=1 Tax=Aromatoleum diolicum TaxID=75796 RepID=A0ABX1Q993_9RHOO|nr:MliC family protein [Aromatoleum diolicum]NMG74934.1 hypothetical protein [Aromatoleum diolicum]